jgi:hypothetical protein
MALRTIGSLWIGKAGSKAKLSGYMDGPNRTKGPKVFVFPNEKATAENRQPQYRLCVEDDAAGKSQDTMHPRDEDPFGDDSVPF